MQHVSMLMWRRLHFFGETGRTKSHLCVFMGNGKTRTRRQTHTHSNGNTKKHTHTDRQQRERQTPERWTESKREKRERQRETNLLLLSLPRRSGLGSTTKGCCSEITHTSHRPAHSFHDFPCLWSLREASSFCEKCSSRSPAVKKLPPLLSHLPFPQSALAPTRYRKLAPVSLCWPHPTTSQNPRNRNSQIRLRCLLYWLFAYGVDHKV